MKNERCSVFVFLSKYYKVNCLRKKQIIIGWRNRDRKGRCSRRRSDGTGCSRCIPVRQKKTCKRLEKFMLA